MVAAVYVFRARGQERVGRRLNTQSAEPRSRKGGWPCCAGDVFGRRENIDSNGRAISPNERANVCGKGQLSKKHTKKPRPALQPERERERERKWSKECNATSETRGGRE